jgi:hypothetical protein
MLKTSTLNVVVTMSSPTSTATVPAHPPLLVLPAVPTRTPVHIGSVGAVLEVVTAGCRQCGLERGRPLLVSLGEPPYLLRGQAEVADHSLKRNACTDALEKPPPDIGGEPCLRPGSPPASFRVSVRLTARLASTATSPSRPRAVPYPCPHARQAARCGHAGGDHLVADMGGRPCVSRPAGDDAS